MELKEKETPQIKKETLVGELQFSELYMFIAPSIAITCFLISTFFDADPILNHPILRLLFGCAFIVFIYELIFRPHRKIVIISNEYSIAHNDEYVTVVYMEIGDIFVISKFHTIRGCVCIQRTEPITVTAYMTFWSMSPVKIVAIADGETGITTNPLSKEM